MLDWIKFASGHTKISHHASLTFQFNVLTSGKTESERESEREREKVLYFGIMIKMDGYINTEWERAKEKRKVLHHPSQILEVATNILVCGIQCEFPSRENFSRRTRACAV